MKKMLASALVSLGLLAVAPAFGGTFTVTSPGPLNNQSISISILNNDGFDLLSVSFNLSGTQSLAAGNPPLVFGGAFGLTGPAGGTAIGFGAQDDLIFGFNFTSFNNGDSFSFDWDPDIIGNTNYGAFVSEQVGTLVTLVTTGGTVSGTLAIDGQRQNLIVVINSPNVPEPSSIALLALALTILGYMRIRKSA